MFADNIRDVVEAHVMMPAQPNSKGWYQVYCEVCGDGVGRTKGTRGNWRFDDETCGYNCYNCGTTGSFDPNREYAFSGDMRKIFEAYNIPLNDCYAIIFSKHGNKKNIPVKPKVVVNTLTPPSYFYKLEDGNKENIIVQKAYEHLKYRNIDPSAYPFYLSNGICKGNPREEAIAKAMMNRLIIPFCNASGEWIYYQGRALDKDSKKRYLNADVPRGNIIYGMDRLHTDTDKPLFVCEGFFDAFHLKGVSLQENDITNGQIELLKTSPRKKVWVPDKGSDSNKVVKAFIKNNWSIAVPDFGSSCKDVDDSIRKYGKLHTMQEIMSNIYDAEYAEAMLIMKEFLVVPKK